jgi:membrane-bound ClpP family serine protease
MAVIEDSDDVEAIIFFVIGILGIILGVLGLVLFKEYTEEIIISGVIIVPVSLMISLVTGILDVIERARIYRKEYKKARRRLRR